MRTNVRTYQTTHPWISFTINLDRADPFLWMALGEIQSKCEHVAGVPLQPAAATALHQLYLAKGIMATTAIEGNTLSEEEVNKRINGKLSLPPSKEYLGKEIDNVLKGANTILGDVIENGRSEITVFSLCSYNKIILDGLEVEEPTVPGEIRDHSVTVGRYRGAPPEDCEFLLEALCEWLRSDTFKPKPGYEIIYGLLKAIVAHLYIAWIHPFGDGNGRTARLLEVRLLLEAGAPSSAAHLLSNHYNQTRSEYYRQLDNASRSTDGDILPFIKYAAEGFCHQLREQINVIRAQQLEVTWQNHVHAKFSGKKSPADHRRRHLILAISAHDMFIPIQHLRRLNAEVAELYAGKTTKTVMRDVNALAAMELAIVAKGGVRAMTDAIIAFLPVRRKPE